MIEKAKIVIKEAEVLLFGKFKQQIPSLISEMLVSFYFIFIGFDRFFHPIKKFMKLLLMLLALSFFIIYFFELGDEPRVNLLFISILIPISVVIFARPHSYCLELVEAPQVYELANLIQSLGVKKESDLNIVNEIIGLAEVRVEKRCKHFYWLLAAYTGVCVFMFDLFTKLSLNAGNFNFQAFIDTLTLPVLFYLFLSPIFFVTIHSYKKANEAVFQLVKLSMSEVRYRQLRKSFLTKKRRKSQL